MVYHCALWKSIGLHLGLEQVVLDVIEADNRHNQTECFRLTLQRWMQKDAGASWSTLELAITNANRGKLGYKPLAACKGYMDK